VVWRRKGKIVVEGEGHLAARDSGAGVGGAASDAACG
jgi:hypothetical protein